jgi:HEAT repeat protein
MLAVGRRPFSCGRVAEVVAFVLAQSKRKQPKKVAQLVECLWDEDSGVALRAADALEKFSRTLASALDPWKAPLIVLLSEATHNKLRWNLAQIVPRLTLTLPESRRAAEALQSYLDDPSSIVKTCALQGLADLTHQDASLLPEVVDLLRIHSRSGTPAMRARGRILLRRLEVSERG